jgi:hypothetical protein
MRFLIYLLTIYSTTILSFPLSFLFPYSLTPFSSILPSRRSTSTVLVFTVSNYTQDISSTQNSVSFHFHDPRAGHNLSVTCGLSSPSSIYLDVFTTCGGVPGKGSRKESVGFRISEGEVVLRRGWWDG